MNLTLYVWKDAPDGDDPALRWVAEAWDTTKPDEDDHVLVESFCWHPSAAAARKAAKSWADENGHTLD